MKSGREDSQGAKGDMFFSYKRPWGKKKELERLVRGQLMNR